MDTSVGRLVLQDGLAAALAAGGNDATVLVRPEQLEVRARSASSGSGGIPAKVVDRAFFGHDAVLHVVPDRGDSRDSGGKPLLVRVIGPTAAKLGSEVLLTVRGPVMAWPSRPGDPPRDRADATATAGEPAVGLTASEAAAAASPAGDGPGDRLVGRR